MENLGGASFNVVADTRPFDAGMAKAEAAARGEPRMSPEALDHEG
jgi:hypothetical protein